MDYFLKERPEVESWTTVASRFSQRALFVNRTALSAGNAMMLRETVLRFPSVWFLISPREVVYDTT